MLDFDTIVIGAGISGMTASIYLKRANINVLLLEKNIPGGQINRSSSVENYPGFNSIDGPSLAMTVYEQVTNLEIDYQYGEVKEIVKVDDYFLVKTNDNEYKTKTVVVASGRYPKELGLENEKELVGRGISYCALCDGMFFKGEEVAVIGGGNSALEESLYLSEFCTKVYILSRSEVLRADEIFVEKIKQKSNIIVKYSTQVKSIEKNENKLSSVTLDNGDKLEISGLFIYIGSNPDTKYLENLNINLDNGYVVTDDKMMSSVPGIFACGDVIKKEVYQLTTAVGDGAIAATSVSKYLK